MFYASFGTRAKAYLIDHFILCLPVGFVAAIFSQNIIDSLGLSIDYSGGMSIIVPFLAMVFSTIPVIGTLDIISGLFNLLDSHTLNIAGFAQNLAIIIGIILIEASINTIQESFGDRLTIGKAQMRIKVVGYDGSNSPVIIIFIRNIFRSLNKFIFFIPVITMVVTAKKQTLYDLLLRTVVVRR